MIEIEGHQFTDPVETHDVYELLSEEWGEKAYNLVRPACDTDLGGCGETTTYMCVPKSKIRSMSFFIMFASHGVYYISDMAYMPVRQCEKCAAARQGFRFGKYNPTGKEKELKRIESAPLLAQEKATFGRIFSATFNKGREEGLKIEAQAKIKTPDRYRMTS